MSFLDRIAGRYHSKDWGRDQGRVGKEGWSQTGGGQRSSSGAAGSRSSRLKAGCVEGQTWGSKEGRAIARGRQV